MLAQGEDRKLAAKARLGIGRHLTGMGKLDEAERELQRLGPASGLCRASAAPLLNVSRYPTTTSRHDPKKMLPIPIGLEGGRNRPHYTGPAPSNAAFHIFTPYIGTPAFNSPQDYGLTILSANPEEFDKNRKPVVSTGELSSEQIMDLYCRSFGVSLRKGRQRTWGR